MDIEYIKEKGWVPCVAGDAPTYGMFKHAEYPGILLMPTQIQRFYKSDVYRNNILSAQRIMDVFFKDIFKEMP